MDTWTVTSVPATFTQGGVAGTIGSKGYFGLGENNSNLWEFDPGAGTWTIQQASLFSLYPGWGPQTSFVLNEKLYVTDYYTAMMFDPQVNQWERIPYHTDDTTRDSWSFISGNHAYLFIGRGKNAGTLYKFDPNF